MQWVAAICRVLLTADHAQSLFQVIQALSNFTLQGKGHGDEVDLRMRIWSRSAGVRSNAEAI